DGGHPERVIEMAVRRMVPKGPLGREQMRKLHIYAGTEHPHTAQQPAPLDIASMNPKNKRSA
ncbi:MAG: uL13 family ribosomal protein, partial [Alphaproteobacteria bacterium]|nr:uL13 family ribosomal protein [Alphaproteobacteria bacterium]